ncbi:hypothetical protein, variant [Aphanomyces astaci]|uniref:HECT-type E3 ubiquitin transferase n=1 Tax=Aphanomyces astaci TaxID=112090 RepID=W4H2T2_APHAT|nr:hypothetical protein, variant [Aphanomyces astaci]ETV85916.1 hypothetical protein, variant [Aphanomyces astaci]|eukprot:XP_009824388.1 hypothetical protein, variant [Aphanomyces astaci]
MFRRDDEVKKGGDGARSKSSVVEEARKKREEREKKRHTERHAVALQAMVRGHHSRMFLLRQLREDVDRKVRDIATLQQMLQKAFVVPTPVLLSIVHAALFATKLGGSSKATLDTEDASRLAQVIALLHSNWTLSGDSYPAAFGSMSIATLKQVFACCFQIGPTHGAALEFVASLVGCASKEETPSPSSSAEISIQHVAMMKILIHETFTPVHRPWWTQPLGQSFTMHMRGVLTSNNSPAENTISWWRLLFHLLEHATSNEDKPPIMTALLHHILTVPALVLPSPWSEQLHRFWPEILTTPLDLLANCPPSPIAGIPPAVFLLANGLTLRPPSTSPCHMLQHDLAWYRHLLAVLPAESYSAEPLAWLHVSASHSVPVVYPSAVVAQLRTMYAQMRPWCGVCFAVTVPGLRKPLSTAPPAPMFPQAATTEDQFGFGYIAQQGSFSILRRLWAKSTSSKWMQRLANPFKSSSSHRHPTPPPHHQAPPHSQQVCAPPPFDAAAFVSLVQLVALFLFRWNPSDKKNTPDLLSFLTFYKIDGLSLVHTLWLFFQETYDVDAIAQSLALGQATPEDPVACVLVVFAVTYHNLLIVLDDHEMHDTGFPVPLGQVERVIVLFKGVLYRHYWLAKDRHNHPFGEYAVESATRLLQSLYNRCARRPFCNVTSWVVGDLDGDDVVERVLHDDQKAVALLQHMPYLLPYADRVRLFQALVKLDRDRYQENAPPCRMTIRRGYVLEDGLTKLNALRRDLKKKVQVHFINEAGTEEVGIDAGGLFKEFWTELSQLAFDPHYGLFQCSDVDHLLFPNPSSSLIHSNDVLLFEFLGRILGKALFENIVVQPKFSRFFLTKLLGNHNHIHDLPSLDPQLYKNLMFLKTYDGDVSDLGLTFSIGQDCFGVHKEVELVPGGSSVGVTGDNRYRYIHLAAHYYLNGQIARQSAAFVAGLRDVVDVKMLHMFNEPELQVLISGTTSAFDMEVRLSCPS